MTIHKALHPKDDVDRLCVSGKEGGRGFARMEDSVDSRRQRLEDYKEKRGGKLITATRSNSDNTIINTMEITRKQKLEENNIIDVLSN